MNSASLKNEKDIQKIAETFLSDPTNYNFTVLVNRCEWGLRTFIFDIVQRKDIVDDILNIVMEHVYFNRNSFNKNISHFSTWLYNIAKNDSLKYLRDNCQNKLKIIEQDISDCKCVFETSDNDTDLIRNEIGAYSCDEYADDSCLNGTFINKEKIIADIYDASVDCIDSLPDKLRIVMVDRYINRKKVDDIAIDNQIPITSVKNWIRKGENLIQEEIKRKYSELYEMYVGLAV